MFLVNILLLKTSVGELKKKTKKDLHFFYYTAFPENKLCPIS